jgi:DNA-binding protein H-NS
MTFTKVQQEKHREEFIEECRQKAWGAACHIDWISKGLDAVLAEYTKLQEEDHNLEAEIKTLETALDYHTVEKRQKRKELQVRRNAITEQTKRLGNHMQLGQKALMELQQSVETNLSLATHAEGWEWKEARTDAHEKPVRDVYVLQKDWSDRKAGDVITAEELGDGVIYKDLIAQGVIRDDLG